MPEPIALDEIPGAEGLFGTDEPDSQPEVSAGDDGKVPCPECDRSFLPSGIKRHITMAHRGGVSDGSSSSGKGKGKKANDLGLKWASFQRGAALMVSFACTDCASVLVADADKDGAAIGLFCEKRPKLRKQLETMLDASDILILVGTLGETAKTMASHHSIGKRIGLDVVVNAEHAGHASGMQGVAQFMQGMSEEDRQELINGALAHMANGNGAPAEAAAPFGAANGF